MADDPGVMGNLPRSRPGRRSEKRTGASGASRKGAAAGGASASRAGTKRTGAAARSPSSRTARSASKPAQPASAAGRGSRAPDPVGDAVRVAAKVAGTGIGIATGILKRLPRP